MGIVVTLLFPQLSRSDTLTGVMNGSFQSVIIEQCNAAAAPCRQESALAIGYLFGDLAGCQSRGSAEQIFGTTNQSRQYQGFYGDVTEYTNTCVQRAFVSMFYDNVWQREEEVSYKGDPFSRGSNGVWSAWVVVAETFVFTPRRPSALMLCSVRTNNTGICKGKTATPPIESTNLPDCTLNASPSTVQIGNASELTVACNPAATSYAWTNTGFSSTQSTGSVSPTVTTVYSVVGKDVIGQVGNTASVAVSVTSTSAPPTVPTCSLSATPSSLSAGSATLLSAICVPAATSYVWINAGFSATTSSGSLTPTATTTYSVTGKNAAGASGNTASATVTVTPVTSTAPTCSLTAIPPSISPGGSSTLSAVCSPAAASYVWTNTGFATTVASGTVSPAATTTYTVAGKTASGVLGNAASATVIVVPTMSERVPNCTLTSSETSVALGTFVVLRANCTPTATSYSWANSLGSETATGPERFVKVSGMVAWSVRGSNAAGTGNVATVAITVPDKLAASKVAVGTEHSCAISDTALWCWGSNQYGQIGVGALGTGAIQRLPARVFEGGVSDIAVGANHTCAISLVGALYCWGANSSGQIGNGVRTPGGIATPFLTIASGVKHVSAGYGHTCATVAAGVTEALWCWGDNSDGQVGNGTSGNSVLIPTKVLALDFLGAKSALGQAHSCVGYGSMIRCWGNNQWQRLGFASANILVTSPQSTGVPVLSAADLAAGRDRTCVVDVIGTQVKCWGLTLDKLSTQLPSSINRATLGSGFSGLAVGVDHICDLLTDKLQCWGSNVYGQLGISSVSAYVAQPTQVFASGVSVVAAGSTHTCAVVFGLVQCWGANSKGQTGSPDLDRNTVTPYSVAGLAPTRVVEYHVSSLNKYFITGREPEKAVLAQFASVYSRTGMQFEAGSGTVPPTGTVPICRFYFAPPLANTHFYGVPADCALLASANQGNTAISNEGLDFAAVIPDATGNCRTDSPVKVYRSFNNRAQQNDGNHRYTVSQTRYSQMTARGYTPEGAVFCAVAAVDSAN